MTVTTLKPTYGREWALFVQDEGAGSSPTYLGVHVPDDFDVSEGDLALVNPGEGMKVNCIFKPKSLCSISSAMS